MNAPAVPVDPAAPAPLCRRWGVMLARGVAAIVFGVLTLVLPLATLAGLLLLFAAYMLVDGVFQLASGWRRLRAPPDEAGTPPPDRPWGWFVLGGLANFAAAALAILMPGVTVLVFVLLLAAWALVSGVLMGVAAWRVHRRRGRLWLALGALLSVAWGVLLFAYPAAGALALTLWLGLYALAFGIAMVLLALRLRRERDAPPAAVQAQPA